MTSPAVKPRLQYQSVASSLLVCEQQNQFVYANMFCQDFRKQSWTCQRQTLPCAQV